MISVANVSMRYGSKVLFDAVTTTFSPGRRYGLTGPNGAGKTTFATEFLPNEVECPVFVNADLIAAGLSPFRPELAAIKAGRLTGSGGAYTALGRARQLAPNDAGIKQRYDDLVARALQPAQAALAARDVALARTSLEALEAELANEPAFKKLRTELDSTETGFDTPLAYASWIVQRCGSPAATMFLAR